MADIKSNDEQILEEKSNNTEQDEPQFIDNDRENNIEDGVNEENIEKEIETNSDLENSSDVSDDSNVEDDTIEISKKEYETLKQERDEYYEKYLRKHADFENYRKRIMKEFSEIRMQGFKEFAMEVIEIFDDFAQAIEAGKKSKDFDAFLEGIIMIETKFKKSLNKFNIEEIDATSQPFDPQIHQALFMEESDEVEEDTVGEVLQAGYRYKDIILREARVKVLKPKTK